MANELWQTKKSMFENQNTTHNQSQNYTQILSTLMDSQRSATTHQSPRAVFQEDKPVDVDGKVKRSIYILCLIAWLPIHVTILLAAEMQESFEIHNGEDSDTKELIVWMFIAIYLPRTIFLNVNVIMKPKWKIEENLTRAVLALIFVLVCYSA